MLLGDALYSTKEQLMIAIDPNAAGDERRQRTRSVAAAWHESWRQASKDAIDLQ